MKLVHALAVLVALSGAVALAGGTRPLNDISLSLRLNGERTHPLQADGGHLQLVSATTAVAQATVTCGEVYQASCRSLPAILCEGSTDGGCSPNTNDPNTGPVIAAGGYWYWVAQTCPNLSDGGIVTTKTVAAVSPDGGGVGCVLYLMK